MSDTFSTEFLPTDDMISVMVRSYIECALWSTQYCTDEDGDDCRPLDDDFDEDDLTPETHADSERICRDFLRMVAESDHPEDLDGMKTEQAGHDLWLTREGHGAGFWDRGLGDAGDRLSDHARSFGPADWYVSEGLIYGCDS